MANALDFLFGRAPLRKAAATGDDTKTPPVTSPAGVDVAAAAADTAAKKLKKQKADAAATGAAKALPKKKTLAGQIGQQMMEQ